MVKDGPKTPKEYVSFGYGKASSKEALEYPSIYNAVTISVGKQIGGDAMKISKVLLDKVGNLKKELIPDDVHISESRNYGATASRKVSELLSHSVIAIISVSLVVMLAMGWRMANYF